MRGRREGGTVVHAKPPLYSVYRGVKAPLEAAATLMSAHLPRADAEGAGLERPPRQHHAHLVGSEVAGQLRGGKREREMWATWNTLIS